METDRKVRELRARAAVYRDAAAKPTAGGDEPNRLFSEIAAQLDREADELLAAWLAQDGAA